MVKAMNVFQFSGVSLSYGENEILNALDFSIGGGEIIGILGPNGSGKTTLLKMMAGVLPPQKRTHPVHGKGFNGIRAAGYRAPLERIRKTP